MEKTSALTMSIAGLLKDVLLVVSSVVIFRSQLTSLQVAGYSISALGMLLYRDYKSGEQGTVMICRSLLSCRGRVDASSQNKAKMLTDLTCETDALICEKNDAL